MLNHEPSTRGASNSSSGRSPASIITRNTAVSAVSAASLNHRGSEEGKHATAKGAGGAETAERSVVAEVGDDSHAAALDPLFEEDEEEDKQEQEQEQEKAEGLEEEDSSKVTLAQPAAAEWVPSATDPAVSAEGEDEASLSDGDPGRDAASNSKQDAPPIGSPEDSTERVASAAVPTLSAEGEEEASLSDGGRNAARNSKQDSPPIGSPEDSTAAADGSFNEDGAASSPGVSGRNRDCDVSASGSANEVMQELLDNSSNNSEAEVKEGPECSVELHP